MSTISRRSSSQPKEVTRELVSEWERTRPALKALNDLTLDKPRGFMLAKSTAVEAAGGEEQFKKVANHWKSSLLWLRGITVEYEAVSKCYLFIEVERHITVRQNRIMKSQEKKHREEGLRLALIRDADFQSDHERSMRVLLMSQHHDLAGKIEAQREHARLALLAPETLPRIVGG